MSGNVLFILLSLLLPFISLSLEREKKPLVGNGKEENESNCVG